MFSAVSPVEGGPGTAARSGTPLGPRPPRPGPGSRHWSLPRPERRGLDRPAGAPLTACGREGKCPWTALGGSAESPEGRCRLAGRRAGRGASRPAASVCEARRAEGKATNSRFKTNLSLLGSFVRRKTDGAAAAGSQVTARSAPRARRGCRPARQSQR